MGKCEKLNKKKRSGFIMNHFQNSNDSEGKTSSLYLESAQKPNNYVIAYLCS